MCLGRECVRFILFSINFIVFLAGICMISIGGLYLSDLKEYQEAIPESYHLGLAPILCITVGSIVALIAFFGCCGSCKQSYCLLTTYAVILIILFLVQIAVGVFGFIQIKDRTDFDAEVHKSLKNIFDRYYDDKSSGEIVDLIQGDMKCCGLNGPSYWPSGKLPKSCHDYKAACEPKVSEFFHSTVRIIAIVALALTATEVIGAIFALCMANSIRNADRRSGYY